MNTKVFNAAPEVVERLVNLWLTSRDGPGEVVSITQSQSMRQSGNVDVTLFVFYKTKEEIAASAAKGSSPIQARAA
jgi:hypothetical protein